MKYYIVIKRINTNKVVGIIPGKEGVNRERLKIKVRKNLSKRYSFRILKKSEIKSILAKSIAKKNIPKKMSRRKRRASLIKRKYIIRKRVKKK